MTSVFFVRANPIATTLAFCKNRHTNRIRIIRASHAVARYSEFSVHFLNKR